MGFARGGSNPPLFIILFLRIMAFGWSKNKELYQDLLKNPEQIETMLNNFEQCTILSERRLDETTVRIVNSIRYYKLSTNGRVRGLNEAGTMAGPFANAFGLIITKLDRQGCNVRVNRSLKESIMFNDQCGSRQDSPAGDSEYSDDSKLHE